MTAAPSVDQFRDEALAFLKANAPTLRTGSSSWGVGDDSVALFDEKPLEDARIAVEEAKDWRRRMWNSGFGWISGPNEYGGRGLSDAHELAYREAEAEFAVPDQTCFGISLGMVAPTILVHAAEHIRSHYLPKMYSGDVIGCQLFSEPGSGSDLASVSTSAHRDGDGWILTGQKVWTSNAQHSEIGEVIARTSPEKPKHAGLTMFLIDMHAPGVTIRPLRQMTGGAAFNEVFLDAVKVPDDHRLGEIDAGWSVAMTTLMNERAAVGGGQAAPRGDTALIHRLVQLAAHLGVDHDPLVRQRLADIYTRVEVAKLTRLRALNRVDAGQTPGPELTLAKLAMTQNLQIVASCAGSILGPRLTADSTEWGTFAWSQFVLGAPGFRLGGGTDEILRNVVAERVLGLPKEPPGNLA